MVKHLTTKAPDCQLPYEDKKPERDDLSPTDICDTLYVQPDAAILVCRCATQEWFLLWPTVPYTKRPI